ncbi:ArsR/SmtB family transcription factor [Pararhodospirillum photometricum]|uniref:Transcriptional regulator, ArsR family n=1 Tax=Pararhodospirillum photometricum DSM 122 TaxID=1150469 RepID=H6SN04_PARPM|nr:metalloregulator ArsR/SmtB family transcription factor [Pararhodospirillum photometricum]CCG06880.1 Transcriptional regulator, ArsR family [Pararhodospirillum photometricum DSM 122]
MEAVLTGLRAAAEATRLRLLALCAHGDLSVSDMVRILGISQPRVSRHLKVMCEAGLLERLPEGAWVFYRLAPTGPGAALARAIVGLLPAPNDTTATLALDRSRLEALRAERAEAAAAYFTTNAQRWDELRRLTGAEEPVEEAIVARLAGRPLHDVLDIGTGTGRLLERLAPLASQVTGLDQSRAMLALARANLDRAGVRNASVRQGDLYALPFPDASFDAVTLHQVLHYVETPARALAEAARVLRPGGRLIIADLAPHDREDLRERHNHLRLGFPTAEISQGVLGAGLCPGEVVDLPGPELSVRLWVADRP